MPFRTLAKQIPDADRTERLTRWEQWRSTLCFGGGYWLVGIPFQLLLPSGAALSWALLGIALTGAIVFVEQRYSVPKRLAEARDMRQLQDRLNAVRPAGAEPIVIENRLITFDQDETP